ncbi:MAG: hypothetical protein RQ936_02315 [Gammaproteobacteria bacterium]|nr:hypothetical protein [Gammaproteobacteria bacterium]
MSILLYQDINPYQLQALLGRYGLEIETVSTDVAIPGSFWKAPEAGLIGNRLYLSGATPVHSALHEACHYICMDRSRRENLHTDAGGTAIEENAVCYLQTLLADFIPEMGRARSFSDMDEWGYSFRLGSAQAWFEEDAEEALAWLQQHKLVDSEEQPSFLLRQ